MEMLGMNRRMKDFETLTLLLKILEQLPKFREAGAAVIGNEVLKKLATAH